MPPESAGHYAEEQDMELQGRKSLKFVNHNIQNADLNSTYSASSLPPPKDTIYFENTGLHLKITFIEITFYIKNAVLGRLKNFHL